MLKIVKKKWREYLVGSNMSPYLCVTNLKKTNRQ